MSTTLRYLRREIAVPFGRSSRKSVLRQENVEEVLEGTRFSIRFRHKGWAQVSLWHRVLVPNDDQELAGSCITTDQRRSLAAGTRHLVRTLLKRGVSLGSTERARIITYLDPTLGAIQAPRPSKPLVVWTNRTNSHLDSYIWIKVRKS